MSFVQNRRRFLGTVAAGTAAAIGSRPASGTAAGTSKGKQARQPKVSYCLNTSTVRGQQLPLDEQVSLAIETGYDGIEPWIRDIEAFVQSGGSIPDLAKRMRDHGLKVESAIGFAQWIVDDPGKRAAALEQAKREMALLKELGGNYMAAPPAGATRQNGMNLDVIAERYRMLLELGAEMEVVPQLEVWGPSATLSHFPEALYVAAAAGHPQACILPDVYHMFRGGSNFESLKLVSGDAIHCFHMNDYPATPEREQQKDSDRVYPGDGVAPIEQILSTLFDNGFTGALSLELFNPTYWQQDAKVVARTGLEKMKAAVAEAT